MAKKKFCKDLIIGENFENEPFVVSEIIGPVAGENLRVILSDRSGTVQCNIPIKLAEDISIREHVGDVFLVSGPIHPEKREPLVIARVMSLCENDYLPTELYAGISDEKKTEYISLIRDMQKKITHPGYSALVTACLTDENLRRLGEIPATHNFYGKYIGGALAATCSVAYMTSSIMVSYIKKGNGITTMPPAWHLLITAALLHSFGNIEYCDNTDPFKKSARGVAMNYFSTLQHSIERVIFTNKIELTEQEIANLLNILNVGVSRRTDTKAISKDGTILRGVINLYGECDAIDFFMANHSAKEGEEFFYAKALSRYLLKEVE